MNSIDQVIARSRQAGAFSERKRFSVARRRGIEKMRKFALADPHFYILELIGCAVSAGAQYLNIEVEPRRCVASFVGGRLLEHELAQLFDFLFASKDRLEIGHIRSLALGLNAAMIFEPERIVVESGDGTLSGTTRMVLHGGSDEVEIGRPVRALGGTYIALEGLDRKGRTWLSLGDDDTSVEQRVIENRCLAAPIPIIVNGTPLFGFSTQRTPALFGYGSVVSFDEGDLYGTIGKDPTFPNPSFRLLTAGVAITSKKHDLVPGHAMGGIVCFDRLRKTADHSGIVEDERLEELWLRLQPYARQLITGSKTRGYEASHLDGTPIAIHELRTLLQAHRSIVVCPSDLPLQDVRCRRAAAIGKALGALVLRVANDRVDALKILGGKDLRVLRPELDSDVDLDLLSGPIAAPPPRPWLAAPVDAEPLPATAFAARLLRLSHDPASEPDAEVRALAERFGVAEVRCTVYSPSESRTDASTTWVRILATERVVWEGPVLAAYPGHVLDVRLGDVSPASLLRTPSGADESLAARIAAVTSLHAASASGTAFARKLEALLAAPLEPRGALARLALAAIVRAVTPVLRDQNGRPYLEFIQVDALELDLLGLRVFTNLEGEALDLREVARLMGECHGLVYGTVPTAPPDLEGLDRSRILDLDETTEQLLIALVGAGSYVRVDGRDVLARADGVTCRDLAVGLRTYPEGPLLVEGDDLPGDPDRASARLRDLVEQLVTRFLELDEGDPAKASELEELRRQTCRQLQWFVCHASPELLASTGLTGVLELPLFVDEQGSPRCFAELQEALSRHEVVVHHGPTLGAAELARAARAPDWGSKQRAPLRGLSAPPFVHHLLACMPRIRPAFDFDLSPAEAGARPALLMEHTFAADGVRGRLGIPLERPAHPDIIILLPGRERARGLTGLARRYGVVGWLEFDPAVQWSEASLVELVPTTDRAARSLLGELLDRLGELEGDDRFDRAIDVLLSHVTNHLVLARRADGHVEPGIDGELASRILSLPLFSRRGGTVSTGHALVRRFCSLVENGTPHPTEVLLAESSPDPEPHRAGWIRRTLHEARVIEHPHRSSHAEDPDPVMHEGPMSALVLASTLAFWLHRLRPDPRPTPTRVHVSARGSKSFVEGAGEVLYIERYHPLTKWVLENVEQDPTLLAWPLLTLYAHLNALLDPVTNDHEQQFQRAVARAIEKRSLHPIASATPAPTAPGADPRNVRA